MGYAHRSARSRSFRRRTRVRGSRSRFDDGQRCGRRLRPRRLRRLRQVAGCLPLVAPLRRDLLTRLYLLVLRRPRLLRRLRCLPLRCLPLGHLSLGCLPLSRRSRCGRRRRLARRRGSGRQRDRHAGDRRLPVHRGRRVDLLDLLLVVPVFPPRDLASALLTIVGIGIGISTGHRPVVRRRGARTRGTRGAYGRAVLLVFGPPFVVHAAQSSHTHRHPGHLAPTPTALIMNFRRCRPPRRGARSTRNACGSAHRVRRPRRRAPFRRAGSPRRPGRALGVPPSGTCPA